MLGYFCKGMKELYSNAGVIKYNKHSIAHMAKTDNTNFIYVRTYMRTYDC